MLCQCGEAVSHEKNGAPSVIPAHIHPTDERSPSPNPCRALLQAKQSGASSVVFIVGRGIHSQDGIVKIRPAVERLIERHNLRCVPDSPHVGCVRAEFVSKEERGWFAKMCGGCLIM